LFRKNKNMFNVDLSKVSPTDLKKYSSLIIIFVILVFAVGGYFLWVPKYNEFKTNNALLNAAAEVVKEKKNYLFELEAHLNNLEEYGEAMSKIDSALPLESSADAMFSYAQKIASEKGLIITKADLSEGSATTASVPDEQGVAIQKLGISITLVGKYSSFKDFVSSVYRNSRLIEIASLSFEHEEKEESLDVFEFDINLETNYYKKLDSPAIKQY